jgi:hypothetical protein
VAEQKAGRATEKVMDFKAKDDLDRSRQLVCISGQKSAIQTKR